VTKIGAGCVIAVVVAAGAFRHFESRWITPRELIWELVRLPKKPTRRDFLSKVKVFKFNPELATWPIIRVSPRSVASLSPVTFLLV
jgi:hypothetical protein